MGRRLNTSRGLLVGEGLGDLLVFLGIVRPTSKYLSVEPGVSWWGPVCVRRKGRRTA